MFLTSRNIGNVFSQTSVIAVLALGQLLVIVTRGIDLSVGSTSRSRASSARSSTATRSSSVLTIAAIIGTGLAVGAANGLIFVYGRVPHPFIVTLATLSIVRGLALWAADGTLISGMPPIVQTIGGGSIDWLPYSIFVVIGLALLCLLLTTRLVWGRWLYAVGGNPEAARRASIPTRRVLVTVYVLSGFAAGVAGLLIAGLIDAGSPTAGDLAELDSIAAVIIGGAAFAGGRGNVGNALVGAFTIGVIRNALNLHNVDAFYQLMAIGVVVLLARSRPTCSAATSRAACGSCRRRGTHDRDRAARPGGRPRRPRSSRSAERASDSARSRALDGRRPRRAARRGARPARRQRSRQVDPDQVPERRSPARQRHDPDGRGAGLDPRAGRRARARHRDRLPGSGAVRQPAADRQLLRGPRARRAVVAAPVAARAEAPADDRGDARGARAAPGDAARLQRRPSG